MSLTRRAMSASRLTLFAALLAMVVGVFTFLHFPSQEEPSVTMRDALVTTYYPGMSAERVENLLAKPLEERLRELPDIRNIVTTVRPGSAIIQITAYDRVTDLDTHWQRVRSKVTEAAAGSRREHWAPSSTTISDAWWWPPWPWLLPVSP